MTMSVYRPPRASVHLEGRQIRVLMAPAEILEINKYAGDAIGSAVVRYPQQYAEDATPDMGRGATLSIGGRVVFRGVVGNGPFDISTRDDQVQLVLYDDKWQMQSNTIGQIGIGTQGDPAGTTGFKDVGFEVRFNPEGKPNKDPSSIEFNTGSTAVYWTLKDILQFVFTHYIGATVATVSADDLSEAYDGVPSDLNLVGQTGLQAVQSIVELSGESWALIPGEDVSTFRSVRPGAGTQREIRLFRPKGGAQANEASELTPSTINADKSILNARDIYQAVSASIVKEHTYTTSGENPLLVGVAGFTDKEYAVRAKVDVSKYSAHGLGSDLSAGSAPKPWLSHLVTRLNPAGNAYLTAAEIAATPAYLSAQPLPKPYVWLSVDGSEDGARLVTGGYRIDTANGTIDFKAKVELKLDTGDDDEEVTIADWGPVEIWLTVATVLELPDSAESESSTYLPRPFYQVIHKPDLIPERREDAWLPDLAGSNNAITKLATDAEEKYVSVDDQLAEVVASAIASTSAIETPLTLEFPFIPELEVGDRCLLRGRSLGVSGSEVVMSITYRFEEGTATSARVQATNITGGIDPSRFVEPS